MREGIEIFSAACQMRDMAAYIGGLDDAELRALICHVGGTANDNNAAGEVLGHALVIAAARFVNQQGGKEG